MAVRPGNVFHRNLARELPLALGGDGVWIHGENGRRWLDLSGGAVVVNLGHAREEIAEAVHRQLKHGYYFHSTMFTTPVVEELSQALAAHAPGDISRFYYMSTGSEAVETAVKLARQIHLARGEASRYKLISRWQSYHGLTMGALAASGRTWFRTPFAPMFQDAIHIPPAYCLRCPFGLAHPACGLKCAQALEEAIVKEGPETVSAFLGETVSGASLAAYAPPLEYWPAIREICDRHGVLLINDEVMSGMGRTGRWFAVEHFGHQPDLMTMGKGLTGGAVPLSAVGVREGLYRAVAEHEGFAHGGTFSHHPVAAAAGLAVVRLLERDNLVARAARMGEVVGQKLVRAMEGSPFVCDVRGLGMTWGVELARDKQTAETFPRAERAAERVFDHLFEDGVVTYKAIGLAGVDGDALMVAPPFIIEEPDLDLGIGKLRQAIDRVLGSRARDC